MEQERRSLRKGFNSLVRTFGNKAKEGLGDTLTTEVNLARSLSITGAIAAPLTYAHFLCERMYETGVVDRMYSPEFTERVVGAFESAAYTGTWMIALPITALAGAVVLGNVGRGLDAI